jgi:hypothetical protein
MSPRLSLLLAPDVLLQFAALVGTIIFGFHPLFANKLFLPIERAASCFARHKTAALLTLALAPLALRLAFLPIAPPPTPVIHDEFSYLLAADTFAHGRLTNPPHALSQFFDTFHVIQTPSYASKYPPAQGAFLALGQLLARPLLSPLQSPWAGVLLSMSLAYAAALWMFYGWLPPRWALLGAVFLILQFDPFGQWANSYWGGFISLIGGSLLIGAYPRLKHALAALNKIPDNQEPATHQRLSRACIRNAIIMALGAAILANSRPFEGLLLCIPVAAALVAQLLKSRKHSQPAAHVTRNFARYAAAPAALILIPTLAFMAYYNFRVTGHATRFPYTTYARQHDAVPPFVWGRFHPLTTPQNPQMQIFYEQAEHDLLSGRVWNGHPQMIFQDIYQTASALSPFWGRLTVMALVLGLAWTIHDRRVRLLLIEAAVCFAGLCISTWLFPHYTGPFIAVIFCLAIQTMRHLRHVSLIRKPTGVGLTRELVIAMLAITSVRIYTQLQTREENDSPAVSRSSEIANLNPGLPGIMRAGIIGALDAMPGDHLIIVRYSPGHFTHQEWVYNSADIDHAKIVWARELPGTDLAPLLHCFSSRHIWLFTPDTSPPSLSPFK